ncbi:MAG TPA: XRE family transcriptional regulator [Candidatus Dormibacteraeota bacterium]|nr:XRE family transcriptional regulator [Candidatus Dormibacteraeota bacterium]
MEEHGHTVTESVARNLRWLRTQRGWSLDVLARRSRVSKGGLVQIEQGQSNPSLNTLIRLSDAFGITLAELIGDGAREEVRITSRDDAIVLWKDDRGSLAELLLGLDRQQHVELWRWRLAPGVARPSDAHLQGTREMIHVLSGEVTVEVSGERRRLAEGDAILFPGDGDHTYRNDGAETARFEMVVIMPGTRPEPGA